MSRSHQSHSGQSAAAQWAERRNNPSPPALPRENPLDIRDWQDGIRILLDNGPFGGMADSAACEPLHWGGRGYAPAELRYEVSGTSDIRDGNPGFWVTKERYFAVYKWHSRTTGETEESVHSYTYDRSERRAGSIYGVACELLYGPHGDQMQWIRAQSAPRIIRGPQGMGPTTVYVPHIYINPSRHRYPTYRPQHRCRFIGGGKYRDGETALLDCRLPFKPPTVLTFPILYTDKDHKYRFVKIAKNTSVYQYAGDVKRHIALHDDSRPFDNLY